MSTTEAQGHADWAMPLTGEMRSGGAVYKISPGGFILAMHDDAGSGVWLSMGDCFAMATTGHYTVVKDFTSPTSTEWAGFADDPDAGHERLAEGVVIINAAAPNGLTGTFSVNIDDANLSPVNGRFYAICSSSSCP
jgi:hypothetical protein